MSEKYEKLFDLPSHLICVIGQDGTFHQTNIAQKHILGWDPEDLVGKPVANFVHAEDADRTVAEVGKLFTQGGVITDFRNRCLHREGGHRWISWSGSARDSHIYCIGTDITAQLNAEEAALATEKQMTNFIGQLPLITWILNPDGIGYYYNDSWYRYTGIAPGEMSGEIVRGTIHPEDRDAQVLALKKALETGESYSAEVRIRRYDGVYRWHLARSVPVKDHKGKIVKWLGASTDIHDQITANERLHSLFMQAPAAITIHRGPDHRYIFSNETNNILLGRKDLVGKKIRDVMSTKDLDGLMPLYDGVYKTGQPLVFDEFPITMDFGNGKMETRHFGCVVQATRDSHGVIDGIMTFAVDVSPQVAARNSLESAKNRAEDANKAKSAFLAHMSHEIRTPLTAIIGFAELALDIESLPEAARDYVGRIQSNGRQLVNIIGDILDLSKAEAKGIETNPSKFNLKSFLKDLFSSMENLAQRKNLVFDFKIDINVPDEIGTDPVLLRQILQNLLSNAIKFTEKGFVQLSAKVINSLVEFEVIDSGEGISSGQVERLFQPFSQGDSSMSRKYGGTGLGLILSRRMAIALGGNVEIVRTEAGKGSLFKVTIQNQKPQSQAHSPESKTPELANLEALKILLVEDLTDNQFLISKIIEKAGGRADIVNNGQEAVQRSSETNYSVILMDIQMPVMDGYEATRMIRKGGFKGKIVALTAHATNDERERALTSGFDEYLTKPLRRESLLSTLANLTH
jgi:PAS domain S-box-containing protein